MDVLDSEKVFIMKQFASLCSLLLITIYCNGQTCCSGGVPLSGNIGLPVSEVGSWQLSFTHDLNTLKTLNFGSETLNDRLRQRKTHSFLLETGYTFSSKFSADLFLSYLRQERQIFSPSKSQTITSGLGDAVILVKYRITSTDNAATWVIGAGPKIPLGSTDNKNDLGINLSADLQPGSGSWDGVIWSSFSYALPIRKSLSLSAVSTVKLNGKNTEFFDSFTYQFGDEYQVVLGLADRIAVGRLIIDPSLSLQYRKAKRDTRNEQTVEATGGEWLFIRPGISLPIRNSLSFNFTVSLPVYSFVNNTQLTPTNRFTTGIFFKINKPQTL